MQKSEEKKFILNTFFFLLSNKFYFCVETLLVRYINFKAENCRERHLAVF